MALKARTPRKPRAPRRRNDRPTGVGVNMDWRTIEAALVEMSKSHGYDIGQPGASGDSIASIYCKDFTEYDLNLTEIAKELAERLGSKA